ncbi:asparagine synthase (glutamine-hydrolyzing) [Vibrio comitans]|uniref:asparagine synthase (glutamine-hydrolyzing) n=1 Tax=Vibrio comitans NBRC 102076 TaxID=1219078 RepID=A0A4Y3IR01_9VIBR|nr:asparagine synthase (glutamine-hydrolyzing) [Vibrio comitans]GEA61971.1 asparagine synthetase [glutamine-hydrolyzing] 1 [Vibrio comitans NBRC 102076]
MCGIYGVVKREGYISKSLADKINECFLSEMGHRGPDSEGCFLSEDKKVLLGHLRLSIIDISGGVQPMFDSEGSIALVFNGEIYNHNDLRSSSNYQYKTKSDTEVIISEFLRRGESFCNNLNGMYGLALFDSLEGAIHLAVDPLGIKSVYVYKSEGLVVFSSELLALSKCLKELFSVELIPNKEAMLDYLYHGMFIGESTGIKQITKLLPGTILTLRSDSVHLVEHSIEYKSDIDTTKPLDIYIRSAIERQVMSDVPICLFLSGGIDSTLLAVNLVRLGYNIKCFTFSFEGNDGIDESSYALQVADQLGLDCEVVSINKSELNNYFMKAIDFSDEPICDFALIPLLKLAEQASFEHKVCIVGDGGDELFYGYTHHRYWWLKVLMSATSKWNIHIHRLFNKLSYRLERNKHPIGRKLSLLLKMCNPFTISYGPFSNCEWLLSNDVKRHRLRNLTDLLNCERENSLNRKLLQKTDRITMRSSMEARVPLLDLDLLAKASTFKMRDCLNFNVGKTPLRKLLSVSGILNKDLVERKKQGFRTPSQDWLKGDLGREIESIVRNSQNIQDLITRDSIDKLFSEHYGEIRDNSQRILALFSLAMFWKKISS